MAGVPVLDVAIAKVAVLLPLGTVTEAGTVAHGLFDDRLTARPPGPAGPVKVTVPVAVTPAATELGAILRL